MKAKKSVLFCLLLALGVAIVAPLRATRALATPPANTSAASMAVIEASSGRLLYAKNGNAKRPIASTTKICTAITVLENCDDIEKTIVVPDAAVGVEGSSIYLQKGEKVKIIDLLYGLMLRSGNDCATALAITVGGSVEQFAALMNETAIKAGATDSHFVNPHGLHHDEHYTTACDLAKITAYAFKNETFEKIVATKTHVMPWEGRDYPRTMHNKNKILSTYEGGDGVKTGFTKKAGRCLVSSATRNGMRVIAVVLNCGPMFEECAALMDKAFEEYSLFCPIENPIEAQASVKDGKEGNVSLTSKDTFLYPIKKG
ncbi:MAG: D-alanyl-D-alanine carboxypeptidase, partial [Clostridiales bacterium]|nr:D-alanyl-D-alanine carboxypeptidase [Clostridiales bacterium]